MLQNHRDINAVIVKLGVTTKSVHVAALKNYALANVMETLLAKINNNKKNQKSKKIIKKYYCFKYDFYLSVINVSKILTSFSNNI